MKLSQLGKIAVSVIVLLATAAGVGSIFLFAPKAEKEERQEVLPTVEVVPVEAASTSVHILSQGLLEAPTETALAAEVGGTVVSVDSRFQVGEKFSKGDVLIEIDPADYASALAQMEANVADAELNLELEKGRSRLAERDWKGVGKSGKATDLVLRKPQLKSAETKLVSAKAATAKARRDLERTKIRAPYDCQIRSTRVEIGSFLGPGTPVAEVFELGSFEVRLPVPLDDYSFIDGSGIDSEVTFTTTIAGEPKQWKGHITRDEGVIDRTSRSVFLVAKIDSDKDSKFLSPGLFVKAKIDGKKLDSVIALPRKALYGKDKLYIIDKDDRLNFRTVTVIRTETDRVLISSGLKAGERVCITNLAAAIDQMKVEVLNDEEDEPEQPESTEPE